MIVDHLYGSSIHDVIGVPPFHYDWFHTAVTDFDEDILINIGKTWYEEKNDKFHNTFKNE